MRKIFATASLLLILCVPAFAGWIDQTGAPCSAGSHGCVFVPDDPPTMSTTATSIIEDDVLTVISLL